MEKKKKTLGKLKLNQLSTNELEKRAMKALKGGCNNCGSDCSTHVSYGGVAAY
ncbi:MAG: TIGR04149 family rSAM-modified RiPP [Tannerellaceae bacterium]|nr:TIGR04149 family rSAM-modified RiPP [Tannerellaceae bacterium]